MRQVMLEDSDSDPEYEWHHHVLLLDLGDGVWISADPDQDVSTVELRKKNVVALKRDSDFPTRVSDSMYHFDALSGAELDQLMAEAHDLASVLGHTQASGKQAASRGEWRVADTAASNFDEVIADATISNADVAVVKAHNALVLGADPEDEKSWVLCQRVKPADKDKWLNLKRNGPGRDLRICSDVRDKSGKPRIQLSQSMDLWRPQKHSQWPFRGPSALTELAAGVAGAGQEFSTYDSFWVQRSGVNRQGTLALTHRNIFTVLHLLQSWDQVDLPNLATAEFLSRWSLMIQTAVRRSPKSPCFDGLDAYLSYSLDESGGIVTSDFQKHVADEQRASATILKQARLQREESELERKRNSERQYGSGGGGGGGGGGRGGGGRPAVTAPDKSGQDKTKSKPQRQKEREKNEGGGGANKAATEDDD